MVVFNRNQTSLDTTWGKVSFDLAYGASTGTALRGESFNMSPQISIWSKGPWAPVGINLTVQQHLERAHRIGTAGGDVDPLPPTKCEDDGANLRAGGTWPMAGNAHGQGIAILGPMAPGEILENGSATGASSACVGCVGGANSRGAGGRGLPPWGRG